MCDCIADPGFAPVGSCVRPGSRRFAVVAFGKFADSVLVKPRVVESAVHQP